MNEFVIIPSILSRRYTKPFLQSKHSTVVLSNMHIGNLKEISVICKKHNKKALVNVNLLGGFSADKVGLKLLKNYYNIDGVVTSNIQVINMAKSIGLFTIQRFFSFDSKSFEKTKKNIENSPADVVDLLPSLAVHRYYEEIDNKNNKPILVSGFIDTKGDIEIIKNKGFSGVTTSSIECW